MSDENKALVRRFWEGWNARDWGAVESLLAPEYAHHYGDADLTLEDLKKGSARLFAAMPDYRVTILAMTGDGDTVAVRWVGRGTHEAPFRREAPSHGAITVHGMQVHRLAGGRIVEDWESVDLFGMLKQMGALPAR